MVNSNALIIEKLANFLDSQPQGRYDVPDRIFAEKTGSAITIRGTVGQGFPPVFMVKLGITSEEELYEALKSVFHDKSLGMGTFFNAAFRFPPHEGGAA